MPILDATDLQNIANAVWDEQIANHLEAGSTGKQLDNAGASGNPWDYPVRTLTMSSSQIYALLQTQDIAIIRGDTISIPIEGLGSILNYKKAWFTIKSMKKDLDSESIIMIEQSEGLLKVNGEDALDSTKGSLVVDNETLGNITISIDAEISMEIESSNYYYDIQWLDPNDKVYTLQIGKAVVVNDVTKAIS